MDNILEPKDEPSSQENGPAGMRIDEGAGLLFCTVIRERFGIASQDIRSYSPLTLAYIGDCIYELVIRTIVVGKGNKQVNKLHRDSSRLVKAEAQADMMQYLLPVLDETEEDIYRRGRNAKSYTVAKNADVLDYRKATGFEALMGYLYLTDQFQRILELVELALASYHPADAQDAQVRNHRRKRHRKKE